MHLMLQYFNTFLIRALLVHIGNILKGMSVTFVMHINKDPLFIWSHYLIDTNPKQREFLHCCLTNWRYNNMKCSTIFVFLIKSEIV